MRIAAAQIVTGEDPQQNFELVEEWATRAAAAEADVVVFPEATQRAFGYSLRSLTQEDATAWKEKVHQLAQRLGILVVTGMFTPGTPNEQGKPRVKNTLLGVGPSVLVSYDKLHLYDAFGFEESRTVEAGQRRLVFPTLGMNIGMATCYDIRFPQLFTANATDGAEVTIVPASWAAGPGKAEQWRTLATARALDSVQYIVACGQALPEAAGVAAPEGAPTGAGHSVIVSPLGEILAEAGEAPELLIADIDAGTVASAREKLPVLENTISFAEAE